MYAADGRQSVWPEGSQAQWRWGRETNLRSGLKRKGAACPKASAPTASAVEPALYASASREVLGVWNGA